MPQMAPMNWILILVFSLMIMMMFNSMNYFSFSYKPSKKCFSSTKILNWKW